MEYFNPLEEVEKMNKKKTAYFSRFALEHMPEMRILEKGGLFPEKDGWRNVAEHCIVVAVTSHILAEKLGADKEKVARAGILHDWYKRKEREKMKEVGGSQGFKDSDREDKDLLEKFGIEKELIELAHSNIPKTGDKEDLLMRTLEEKIIHLSDHLVSGSEIVDFRERMDAVIERNRKDDTEFSERFRSQYDGKSLFELQREVCESEEQEFEDIIGLERGTLVEYVRKQLMERIEKEG